jgi:hypothetical protein
MGHNFSEDFILQPQIFHRIIYSYISGLGIDGRIILKLIFEKWDKGMNCIDLAQDKKLWWALVNAIMDLWVL